MLSTHSLVIFKPVHSEKAKAIEVLLSLVCQFVKSMQTFSFCHSFCLSLAHTDTHIHTIACGDGAYLKDISQPYA